MRLSYGGWRTDSLRISVVPRQAHLLLNESWKEELGAHWQPFGAPSPRVVTTDDGVHAMLNNGDGVFQSGVHSLTTYPLQHGLSLDAMISTTITMTRWQVVRIGMYAGVDSMSLARWNHADGWAFGPGRSSNAHCDFWYPSGTEGMRTYAESYAAAAIENIAPSPWRTGAWFRIRLQVLPDGRCAFSGPDGAVIYSESIPADVRNRAHIFIYGNSPNTNMLVGPVTIMEGIPDGIDWVPKTPPLPRTRR